MFENELPGDKTLISIPSFSVPDLLAVVSPTVPRNRLKLIKKFINKDFIQANWGQRKHMMNVPVIQTP